MTSTSSTTMCTAPTAATPPSPTGHTDYARDGHLHHPHDDHVDEHVIDVGGANPADCSPDHACAACGRAHARRRLRAPRRPAPTPTTSATTTSTTPTTPTVTTTATPSPDACATRRRTVVAVQPSVAEAWRSPSAVPRATGGSRIGGKHRCVHPPRAHLPPGRLGPCPAFVVPKIWGSSNTAVEDARNALGPLSRAGCSSRP